MEMLKRRWRWRLGGLSWRVAVSYFLVTLVAALTIEGAVTLGAFLQDLQAPVQPPDQVLTLLEEQAASQMTPYLDQTIPDKARVQSWLGSFLDTVSTAGSGEPAFLVVVDQHDRPLAAVSCASPVSPGPGRALSPHRACACAGTGTGSCTAITATQATALLSPAYTQAAISVALEGALRPVEVAAPEHHIIIAASIMSAEQQVLGALVSVVALRTESVTAASALHARTFGKLVSLFLGNLQPAAFYFVLLATAIGTATGLFISRGITRRLHHITLAAGAWSKGEFAAEVRDPTHDEIGQLGQDLNGMAEQLHALLATREELAAVEERNRLARDLHDSVKQNVFATALLVGAARSHLPPDTLPAQTYLAEAEALAEQTRQELTALIRELRPARLEDKGLSVVLRDYAEDWSRRMGIAVALHMQGERVIALDVEEALFRVAQEALANIAHHSGAAHVTLHLRWDGIQVRLTITDDGTGFDVAHASGRGVGLASMRERMAAHNGTLHLASAAGATTVQATVPLQSAEKLAQEATL